MDEPQTGSENSKEARAAEAAAIRRRWITLGEMLAVAAVLISALTLWNSYSERAHSEASRNAEERKAATRAETLLIKATPADGGRRLTLAALNPEQTIQSQTIAFPSALGTSPVETTGDARIEAGWFGEALRKARKAKGRPDESKGDERLPLAITTRYLVDGKLLTDVALYDIGYVLEGHLLGGSTVRLRGLSLRRRLDAASAGPALDAAWPAGSAHKK